MNSSTDHCSLPTSHSKPCATCGNAVPYEPIDFDGVDLTAAFPVKCDVCTLEEQKEHRAKQRQQRIEHCQQQLLCIGERLRQTDVNHPKFNRDAWAVLKTEVEVTSPRNILLVGPAGTCKSRFFYLLLKSATWRGLSIGWTTTDDLSTIAEDHAKFNTRNEAREKIQKLKYIDRLVIDDLGKSALHKDTEEMLWKILSFRYDHNKPIWVSANTHPEELLLHKHFTADRGAPIVGRILEDAQQYTLKPFEV